MPDIFRPIILRLQEIGAFNFLFPFLLTSAIIYGLLRKSKVFGDPEKNVAVNSVIALVAAFMVWAFPIMQGIDVEAQLSTFFAQGLFVSLSLMFALMFFSMVAPDPSAALGKFVQNREVAVIVVAIIVGIFIFLTSGLFNLIIPKETLAGIPSDILLGLGVILIALLPLFWIATSGKASNNKGNKGG